MAREVLRRPLLTEKATLQSEKGVYHFEVLSDSNKIEIGEAVTRIFGVQVQEVRTTWQKPKHKTQFTRKGARHGVKQGFKKAMVQLTPGQTIDVFAPMENKDRGAL
jgi:large subunit ribosomal protein L23